MCYKFIDIGAKSLYVAYNMAKYLFYRLSGAMTFIEREGVLSDPKTVEGLKKIESTVVENGEWVKLDEVKTELSADSTTDSVEESDIDRLFICPLTGKRIENAACTPSGFLYEETALVDYVEKYGICPASGWSLKKKDIRKIQMKTDLQCFDQIKEAVRLTKI